MRVKTAKITKRNRTIEWRSHEPSRLETFSDGVFAFAVTLIIVSLEVPKTYVELFETMKGTFSFAACFVILFLIWNNQNIFFRYYGLNDGLTVSLNAALLFVVLVYVYPLKFLFNLVFLGNSYLAGGTAKEMIADSNVPILMSIYGAGYTAINFLFYLMYANAIKLKAELKLTELELFHTKTVAYIFMICCFIGIADIAIAWVLPLKYSGFSGGFYTLIGPAYFIWYSYRGKVLKKQLGTNALRTS
jgi:uncharacterized membrane protein